MHMIGSDLSSLVSLSAVRLNRRLRAQRTDHCITGGQLSALDSLQRCGALTPGALAAAERVAPPTMTRVIGSLEGAGLISRQVHPVDRRQALVTITPAGTDLLAAEISARERWLDERLAELSDDQRCVLAQAIEIIDRIARC